MNKILNTKDKHPVISSKDLSISYELHRERTKLIALKNISLDVKKGEFVVLVGPSGCGKTSFINAVAGLVEPESGDINVNGNPVKGPGPDRAMVFQDYALMPWKTVESNIRIPFEFQNLGISIEDQNKRIKDCINLVDLNGFEKSFPYELSGGMRQRIMIAIALVCEPTLLIADEPTTALDATTSAQIIKLLITLKERRGMSLLLISHDLDLVARVSDKVIVMKEGNLVEMGDTNVVLSAAKHPYTKAILACKPSIYKKLRRLPTIEEPLHR